MTDKTKPAPCLAFLGTGSEVGKSVLAAAMCRVLANRGFRVMPFKAQNMSNNSGVTPEGLEMGRAQIVQAEAAKTAPHVDMNPVLLKPAGDNGSQVVIMGKATGHQQAAQYYREKNTLFKTAAAALDRLRTRCDVVIMEGAGSCAEVNLMDRDFVNLPMAAYAEAPVVLVADIDKGGVFAQITGTLQCLPRHFSDRIAGFVINRFRGDPDLFSDGLTWLEQKTEKTAFGVIPWFDHIRIEAEDAVSIEKAAAAAGASVTGPAAAVVRLPRISNFTDFDPLDAADGLSVHFMDQPRDLSRFCAVILPGTKNTRADLQWLHKSGWAQAIRAYHQNGGHVLGICGGYQMLGKSVNDPEGLEGEPGFTHGLGLLPVETVLAAPKTTTLACFFWDEAEGTGYEIHMGQTNPVPASEHGRPLFRVTAQKSLACDLADGFVSADNRVMGTYMHGLFDRPGILEKWLAHVSVDGVRVPDLQGPAARDHQYDLLAQHFEAHADIAALMACLGLKEKK
ncbi:MAG: cobyric acid synthase [Desulfobacteraceae bacterium]|nr:cobyric acid synthase [Desulfobacteraceae bacterium]